MTGEGRRYGQKEVRKPTKVYFQTTTSYKTKAKSFNQNKRERKNEETKHSRLGKHAALKVANVQSNPQRPCQTATKHKRLMTHTIS